VIAKVITLRHSGGNKGFDPVMRYIMLADPGCGLAKDACIEAGHINVSDVEHDAALRALQARADNNNVPLMLGKVSIMESESISVLAKLELMAVSGEKNPVLL
jgi:hypothetical protein